MKTLKLVSPYAIPVALLMMSVAFAAPAANAERPGYETVNVKFVYDPTDSAPGIYKVLNRTAHKVCNSANATKSIRYNVLDKECKADLMEKVVKTIGRTDLAAIHYGERMALIATR